MNSVNDFSQYKGVFLLRCKKCREGLLTFQGSDGQPSKTKPKGLRVGDYKCHKCRGAMAEAVVRNCYTCKTPAIVLKRSEVEDACLDCGDKQGYATIRILSGGVTGWRSTTLGNGGR
jgi:predicted RNA-binding Zn-ribbon protein involved in translation (DUF1610 family)